MAVWAPGSKPGLSRNKADVLTWPHQESNSEQAASLENCCPINGDLRLVFRQDLDQSADFPFIEKGLTLTSTDQCELQVSPKRLNTISTSEVIVCLATGKDY